MFTISGRARRSFIFPSDLPIAYAYYGDVSRILTYLPQIVLVRDYGPDRFRLLYSSTELGAYQVRIFADVQTTLDRGWVIRVHPWQGMKPAPTKASLRSTTAQGTFQSKSVFYDEGDHTRIEYSLELRANLGVPLALKFMPGAMVTRIAQRITGIRIREITDGFIERSIAAFPYWLDEFEDGRPVLDQIHPPRDTSS